MLFSSVSNMFSRLPFKSSQRILFVLVGVLNVVFILFALIYLEKISFNLDLPSFIGKSEASGSNSELQALDSNSDLQADGYIIEPQNVKFQFINPKGKEGNKDEILAINRQTFENVMSEKISQPKGVDLIGPPEDLASYVHANATIIALARNSEAGDIASTIRKFEVSFNSKFQYPYTFLNDEPFTDRFKDRMRKLSSAPMEFVLIPPELWNQPDNIDKALEEKNMNKLADENVSYAKMLSYHNMCRFYSGNFYNVPELQKYRYYWRIEPKVNFFTDLKYDVFKYMEMAGKKYGFTINLYDIEQTVETLWPETLKFLNTGDNYKYINKDGAFQWLLDDLQNPQKSKVANGYSTCHFWSNFEIADMDFYRNSGYNEWFKHLESTGKFYYERWGDAPVHSMGVALFASKNDAHWFRDIGYYHDPYQNCPNSDDTHTCKAGEFSRWEHLQDQNCMANWIDYSMDKHDY